MALSILAPILAAIGLSGRAQEITPDVYRGLEYRYIGPVGNRISAVAGVPGDPLVYYAGSANRIEIIRKQLQDLATNNAAVGADAKALETNLCEVSRIVVRELSVGRRPLSSWPTDSSQSLI
jgi:hypothetical protein